MLPTESGNDWECLPPSCRDKGWTWRRVGALCLSWWPDEWYGFREANCLRPVGTRGGCGEGWGPCACPGEWRFRQGFMLTRWISLPGRGQAPGPLIHPAQPLVPTGRLTSLAAFGWQNSSGSEEALCMGFLCFRADELLHEIGQDFSPTAVQVKAISMKAPAVFLGNPVKTAMEYEQTESIAIE